jgi:hypothetical protein
MGLKSKGIVFASIIGGILIAGQVGQATPEKKKIEPLHDPDVIMIDNKGYKKDRKGPVRFTHKQHARVYKILCWECHHVYDQGENVWVPWGETKKCRQCHDPIKNEPTNKKLQKAYHYNCKVCHEALAKKSKEKTIRDAKKCTNCHLKQQ